MVDGGGPGGEVEGDNIHREWQKVEGERKSRKGRVEGERERRKGRG